MIRLLCSLLVLSLSAGCSDNGKESPADTGPTDAQQDATITPDGAPDGAPDGSDDGPFIPQVNLLDSLDPAQGMAADTLVQLDQMLDEAVTRFEVTSRTRILDLDDPLGIARLVGLLEWETTLGCNPKIANACVTHTAAQQALQSYSSYATPMELTLTDTFAALDAWARLALAKHSLQLINLFDQLEQQGALTITAQTKSDWTQVADALKAEPSLLWTDWTQVIPANLQDTLLFGAIMSHEPVPYPSQTFKETASELAEMVLTFVEQTWGKRDPFYHESLEQQAARCGGQPDCKQQALVPMPDPQSPGAQAVRALGRLRGASTWTDGKGELTTFLGAISDLVGMALQGEPLPMSAWQAYQTAGSPFVHQLHSRRDVISQHASVAADLGTYLDTLKDSLDDPNATDYGPNAVTRDGSDYDHDWWTNWAPAIVLDTADAAAGSTFSLEKNGQLWVANQQLVSENLIVGYGQFIDTQPSSQDWVGSSTWPIAGPTKITWRVTTSQPLDHVDLRIFRTADLVGSGTTTAVPFRHFIEKANQSGQFPFATWFNPLEDPQLTAQGPDTPTYKTYVVKAVAVDTKGKHSSVACLQLNFRYGQIPDSECDPGGPYMCPADLDLEPIPTMACISDHYSDPMDPLFDWLEPNTVEVKEVSHRNGHTGIYFKPSELTVNSLTDSVTLVNNTSSAIHYKAIYTSPYMLDLSNPFLTDNPIGGVAPLDFGSVDPGQTSTIPLPAGTSQHFQWILYDKLGEPKRYRHFKVWINLPGGP